jgi:hypothetical protein
MSLTLQIQCGSIDRFVFEKYQVSILTRLTPRLTEVFCGSQSVQVYSSVVP